MTAQHQGAAIKILALIHRRFVGPVALALRYSEAEKPHKRAEANNVSREVPEGA